MFAESLLFKALESSCPFIHQTRLNAVMDVATALQNSSNLSLSEIGRNLTSNTTNKNKIKKVDRLEGNEKLYKELTQLYKGLSTYVFSYLSQDSHLPIIIDVCFMKDDREIQMLSAEVATKGRSIPIYREVFSEGELKGRTKNFLKNLSLCIPKGREVIVIMDAGFYDEWFSTIESYGWYWICRIRQGKSLKFEDKEEWISIKDFIPEIKKTKNYDDVLLTKRHKHICRIITTVNALKGRKVKVSRGKTTSKIASGRYNSSAREPWILATNLPSEKKSTAIINLYRKRMQIEESFRDVKSHQFGLSARYIRTTCTKRWAIKMLLAAIVQITYWIIGIIGHSQGMQQIFQANTVRDKKVFSYFTLGRFIIEYDKLNEIKMDNRTLSQIIQEELSKEW